MTNNRNSVHKRYIFMPNGIPGIGGAELYILGKQKWLRENGWEVHVLSSWYSNEPYKIRELDSYRVENMPVLNSAPFAYSDKMRNTIIRQMMEHVHGNDFYEKTIIESHTGAAALWGEILADKLNAKHVVSLINETFDAPSYQEKLDYFIYKYKKGELMGGLHAHQLLFGDKINIDSKSILTFKLQEDPVQDVEDDRLQQIIDLDYTICYLGRSIKPYFPHIIRGVEEFAKNHCENSIQFVIIGDTSLRKDLINSLKKNNPNIRVVLMGDMFPLPRVMFKRFDVVIAGSGSARCAAYEGIPTIVADSDNYMANGILGYDTTRSIGRDSSTRQRPFEEAIEEVLIKKDILQRPFLLPPIMTVNECCEQNMQIIGEDNDHEYYDLDSLCSGKASLKELIKARLSFYAPELTYELVKIKEFVKRNQ